MITASFSPAWPLGINRFRGSTFLAAIAPFVLVLFFPFNLPGGQDDDVVATIDGEPVRAAELRHWMLLNRAAVHRHYYQNHGVRQADGFWETSFHGHSPLQMLRETALRDIARHKVQQILAKENKLVETTDFSFWMRAMESVNQNHREQIASGRMVYGASQYTAQTFFNHAFDHMVENLKAFLAQNEFRLDEETLRDLYRKRMESLPDPKPEFEAIKGLLQMHHVDEQYIRLVDEMTARAKIEIHPETFNRVQVWQTSSNR